MSHYNKTQRTLFGALVLTGAVKADELEVFGLTEKQANWYAYCVSYLLKTRKNEAKLGTKKLEISLEGYQLVGELGEDPKDVSLL